MEAQLPHQLEYKLNPEIRKAVFEDKRNIAFTGPGGTGKSFEIKLLKLAADTLSIQCPVTSTTGVSALGVNGTTIHRWSCIKLGKDPVMVIVNKILNNKDALKRILGAKILVIDEVSMFGSKTLYLVHDVCQRVRDNYHPFGGLQLVLSFDFLQLPPVNDEFAFKNELWEELNLKYFKFDDPKRFPDLEHFKLLKRARLGSISDEDDKKLRKRVVAYHDYLRKGGDRVLEIKPTKVFSKKIDVEKVNLDELAKLPGDPFPYKARDKFVLKKKKKGEKLLAKISIERKNGVKKVELLPVNKPAQPGRSIELKENLEHITNPNVEGRDENIIDKKDEKDYTEYFNTIVPQHLFFKIGAQVMLTFNVDIDLGLVNGSRGVIVSCDEDGVVVQFINGITTKIGFNTYEFEDDKMKVSRLQLPFILAWALTIHKLQGCSLDFAVIDLGPSIFCPGMGYVALSRVRTLEGIYLTNYVRKKIYADEDALAFEEFINDTLKGENGDHLLEGKGRDEYVDNKDEEEQLEFVSDNEEENPDWPNQGIDKVKSHDSEEEVLEFATDSEDEEEPGSKKK